VTVAAVVLAPDREDAHALVGGVAAIRRIADIAWAGGAYPIVVVTADETESLDIGGPLSGAAGAMVVPSDATDTGGWPAVAAGALAAREQVDGTDSVLVWPGRFVHVDAETVTSLIEAHGADVGVALIPTFDGTPGWPLLVPAGAVADAGADRARAGGSGTSSLSDAVAWLRAAGVPTRPLELGDPGIVHDIGTAAADLPEFRGPPEPVAGTAPDWGDRVPSIDPTPALPPGAR
jgi:hypothetical protein